MPETPDNCLRRPWTLGHVADALHRHEARRQGSELANRKLCWVYLDANWSFYRRCSPAEKGQDDGVRFRCVRDRRLPQVGIANESDQVT
jgi:hypothetical protein